MMFPSPAAPSMKQRNDPELVSPKKYWKKFVLPAPAVESCQKPTDQSPVPRSGTQPVSISRTIVSSASTPGSAPPGHMPPEVNRVPGPATPIAKPLPAVEWSVAVPSSKV